MKKVGNLIVSAAWLVVAIVRLAEGKPLGAIPPFIGCVIFFVLFLYYSRKKSG